MSRNGQNTAVHSKLVSKEMQYDLFTSRNTADIVLNRAHLIFGDAQAAKKAVNK